MEERQSKGQDSAHQGQLCPLALTSLYLPQSPPAELFLNIPPLKTHSPHPTLWTLALGRGCRLFPSQSSLQSVA